MKTDLSTIHKVVSSILLLSLTALIVAAAVTLLGRGDAKDFLPLVFAGMGVLGGLLAKTSTQGDQAPAADASSAPDKTGLSAVTPGVAEATQELKPF